MMEKPLRAWRVMDAFPYGQMVWFDASSEVIWLYSRDLGEEVEDDAEGVDFSVEGSIFSASASESEARALAGNEQMNLMDLTKSSSEVIL